MLLEKLSAYFDRLEGVAPPMYQKTPIRWLIELDPKGKLLGFVPTEGSADRKKGRGKEFLAPFIGRSSGIRAKLLADNGEYTLGVARNTSKQERVNDCHGAYVEEVRRCAFATREPAVKAVLTFLEKCPLITGQIPEDFEPSAVLTFRVDGVLPIELPAVREYWASVASAGQETAQTEQQDANGTMQCLVCGQLRPAVKRLPFKIKGIPGGQTSGTALISANSPAFESYGLQASLIAPTCQECGERFSKAANALIEGENTHIRIPPLIYLFWTREECDFNPASLLSDPDPGEVKALVSSVFSGAEGATQIEATPFYATAFSASGARVAVRDWLDTTVERAKRSLARYFVLQRIVEWDGSEGRPLGLYALTASTVRDGAREPPSNVPQSLLHVALRGGPLPMGLLYQAVKRNRAEQGITRPRAALIKMVLLSQATVLLAENTMTELDVKNHNPAYLCGRLMGILEGLQRVALGNVGANVTSRFFGTASSAPASVFGNLLRSAQHHLDKLRKGRPGAYQALERRLEEVMSGLPGFPRVLSLEEQGLFSLGYFHQRAADRAAAIARRQSGEIGAREAKESKTSESGGESND